MPLLRPKADAKKSHPVPPTPKGGVKTPGIQIPFETIKPEAELAVENPVWATVGDTIIVENRSQDVVVRIDSKTNKLLDPILGVKQPCAGAVVAFGSLWVPSCGAQTLTRYEVKTSKLTATISPGVADAPLGIAATADSVWLITDSKTTLSRIDPAGNNVVGEVRLPASCNSVSFGETSLWVTCPADNRVYRVNPETNLMEKRIETSAGPRSVAFLDGSVWVLCEKDGKIDRIDPKTNRVLRSVELSSTERGRQSRGSRRVSVDYANRFPSLSHRSYEREGAGSTAVLGRRRRRTVSHRERPLAIEYE